jgi:hypothetical protein
MDGLATSALSAASRSVGLAAVTVGLVICSPAVSGPPTVATFPITKYDDGGAYRIVIAVTNGA